MEPRPPRPRTPQPAYPGAVPGYPAAAPGQQGQQVFPYAPLTPPGAPVVPPPPVPLSGEPLLPRQQRKRRGMALGVLGFIAGLALLAGLAWFLRDRLMSPSNQIAQNPQGQVVVETPVGQAPAVSGSPAGAPAAANLLATATPTATPPPRPTSAPPTNTPPAPPTATAEMAVENAIIPLMEALPGPDLLPEGLVEVESGERSKGEVVNSLAGGDPMIETEADQLLTDWGWEGNAYRNYGPADGVVTPAGLTAFNVSAHRFADANSADDALIYFSDRVVAAQGLGDVEVELMGDAVRMLSGAPDGAPISVLYLRKGNTMYRIGAAGSAEVASDPVAALAAVGQAMSGQ